MRNHATDSLKLDNGDPAGVTLTEVLMSLMIMSIGISAVAVLFPISVLRSVQASQLTNAAILKYNAEALLRIHKQFVFDPNGDGDLNEHISARVERRYIIDPIGYFQITSAGTAFEATSNVASPFAADPRTPSLPGNGVGVRGAAEWFGNVDTDSDGLAEGYGDPVGSFGLPRFDAGVRFSTVVGANTGWDPSSSDPAYPKALTQMASTIAKLGDGWETQLDTVSEQLVLADGSLTTSAGSASLVVGVKVADDVDLSGISDSVNLVAVNSGGTRVTADPELVRMIIFSVDGRSSVTVPVIYVNQAQRRIIWTEDYNLDGSFDAATEDLNSNSNPDQRALSPQMLERSTLSFQPGRVVIQTARTHDFSWLLTVRRGSDGQARGIDVVVLSNKSTTADDERLYTATFTKGQYRVPVTSDGGKFANSDVAQPALRRGGYVLDVQNARWYRVRGYSSTATGWQLELESPVIDTATTGKAMFLPGVIEVYPMGSMALPQDFR
jgi:prepilin-type N-terminal cleavage/methylation domain-containing protein